MRFNYTLYPEAKQKLEQSGLDKRIIAACKQDNFPSVYGALFPDEFRGIVDDMKERGFYKKVPKEAGARYYGPLQDFDSNVDNREWAVKHHDREVREHAENEDFMLLSGYLASHVLTPGEFWAPERFGFSSIFDLFGVVGARAWAAAQMPDHREGHVWQSDTNGRNFSTQVTGDSNGDFRLFRTDITPYETTDPLGNRVLYRPEMNSDYQTVAAYHSVEPELLVSVLKYVEQEKLLCPILTNSGLEELFKDIAKNGLHAGNYADFGMGDQPCLYFLRYRDPVPQLDQDVAWNPHRFISGLNGTFAMYVGPDRSLVFRYESREQNRPKQVALELPSSEVDQVIKGLFVQAAGGLGRTSVKQLVDILKYRFSDQFAQDQKEWNAQE